MLNNNSSVCYVIYLFVHRADSSNEAPVANGLTEFGEVSLFFFSIQ